MGKYTLLALLVIAEQLRQKPSARLLQLVVAHLRHLHRLNSSLVGIRIVFRPLVKFAGV